MILSCAEVHFDNPHPSFRQWIVSTTPSETPAGILEKCGKIPKPNGENDKHTEWKCCKIECEPMDRLPSSGETLWKISAHYKPKIIVPEPSDEPQFPPYTGPKGKQPDGSFVLTPRAWSYLHKAMLWSTHWGLSRTEGPPAAMAASSMKDFWKVFCEETGMDMEVYT